jgi:TrwC relaxase
MVLRQMATWDRHMRAIQRVTDGSPGAKKRLDRVAGSAWMGPVPGQWVGRGVTDIGLSTGDSVSVTQISALFGDPPRCPDTTQIARPVVADVLLAFRLSSSCDRRLPERQSLAGGYTPAPQPTGSGNGLELIFTTSRSVSALWALAPRPVARQIDAAHRAAVIHTIAWLDSQASYARIGYQSVRQVDVQGLLAVAFTHHSDRYYDPHLHTHVAISGHVRALDGRWLTLDQATLHRAALAASEHYMTRLEAELADRVHLRFPDHGSTGQSEPTPEIRGVDPTLTDLWPTHSHITYPAHERRPPELRRTWRRHALSHLGHPDALSAILTDALHPATEHGQPPTITEDWTTRTSRRTLIALQATHPTWQIWHLHAEAERQTREAAIPLDELENAVDRVIDRVLTPAYSTRLGPNDPITEPPQLRRRDGSSVYRHAGTTHYTSSRGEHPDLAGSTDAGGQGSSPGD